MRNRVVLMTAAVFVGALVLSAATHAAPAGRVSGELRRWHRVTITFAGPETGERAAPNPFLDYRLDVTFVHEESGTGYAVPGFYAADGNAAETGAQAGDRWRVHFCPGQVGTWTYEVSFRRGKQVAVNEDPQAGTPVSPPDGLRGVLQIAASDKAGADHRAKGRLQYVGERYLKFAATGEYFLKQGADAPENFLAYADFDGDFKSDGQKDHLVKTWQPHVRDWRQGDPTWRPGKGKGIIGAVNYLADEGMNAISFLTLNIGGDDRNVFPYLHYDERYRMDVSRLAQWEIVFRHMDRKGIYLHFKTQETENDHLLDGGDLGVQRRLYYRELIARFAHHLALNWNLGEENTNTHEQRKAFAAYIRRLDPYDSPIVVHTFPGAHEGVYSPLLGFKHFEGPSLQTSRSDFGEVHDRVLRWVRTSEEAGRPWVVACDEPGDALHALVPDSDDPTHNNARKNALWGTLMAGGAGNEWYFGYRHDHSDLTCQDWRSRDRWWDQCRVALEFFHRHLPFWEMTAADELTARQDDYCLAKKGEVYAIYLPAGEATEVTLPEGIYGVSWYNPRTGGDLLNGSVRQVRGPGLAPIGTPPGDSDRDWVVLVQRVKRAQNDKSDRTR